MTILLVILVTMLVVTITTLYNRTIQLFTKHAKFGLAILRMCMSDVCVCHAQCKLTDVAYSVEHVVCL